MYFIHFLRFPLSFFDLVFGYWYLESTLSTVQPLPRVPALPCERTPNKGGRERNRRRRASTSGVRRGHRTRGDRADDRRAALGLVRIALMATIDRRRLDEGGDQLKVGGLARKRLHAISGNQHQSVAHAPACNQHAISGIQWQSSAISGQRTCTPTYQSPPWRRSGGQLAGQPAPRPSGTVSAAELVETALPSYGLNWVSQCTTHLPTHT